MRTNTRVLINHSNSTANCLIEALLGFLDLEIGDQTELLEW
jgi:hypothetical protein